MNPSIWTFDPRPPTAESWGYTVVLLLIFLALFIAAHIAKGHGW